MLFRDYLGEPDPATAARREGDWLSVRDMGWIDAQGRLCLAGRQQRMIVTQGKNLFPDEVEARLCLHPSVERASVHGLRDSLRGQQIVAVLRLAPHPPASPRSAKGPAPRPSIRRRSAAGAARRWRPTSFPASTGCATTGR